LTIKLINTQVINGLKGETKRIGTDNIVINIPVVKSIKITAKGNSSELSLD
jgi:hypothetical protein